MCSLKLGTDIFHFSLEVDSLNSCTLQTGAWYSLGAAVAYLILSVLAPVVPISPFEERKGCCIVRGKPKKGEPSASRNRTARHDTVAQTNEASSGKSDEAKKSELKERDVEANNPEHSVETTDDDEKTTNTNHESTAIVADKDAVEVDKGGFCSGVFFDNICGKNEQRTEIQPKSTDDK